MSNVMTPSWTPSGPAPMNVIRSTHSSRLRVLPRSSIRSSYGTSTFVTDGADIVSIFIQYEADGERAWAHGRTTRDRHRRGRQDGRGPRSRINHRPSRARL